MSSPLLPVYRRHDICLTHGRGVWLYDVAGAPYLDFAAGIATNILGHQHPRLIEALMQQGQQLWHCSNLFHTPPLTRFATALTQACFADQVFFCSSGTEAVEAALKTMRRYHHHKGRPERYEIIVAEGAFHGRTLGALSTCSRSASRAGFEPLLPGVRHVPFHDEAALEAAVTPQTAGILLETIQGEGGVRAHQPAYLQAARRLCDDHGLLLCLDEIQCGYGRTGELFAFEAAGIRPDLCTVAKGIGGGFPLGALLVEAQAGSGMTPGSHGSTYGSNPLACAVGEAVLRTLQEDKLPAHAAAMGRHLEARLETLVATYPGLYATSRGRGLMCALVLQPGVDKYALSDALLARGLIVAPAVSHVLRLLPPLIITPGEIDVACDILTRVSAEVAAPGGSSVDGGNAARY